MTEVTEVTEATEVTQALEANEALQADEGAPATQGKAGVVSIPPPSMDDVEEALRDVVDPELGINVVDLGLIYGLDIADDATVTVDMTLTSAACPLTDVIEDQANTALTGGPKPLASAIKINWVWMPPWGPDKISDDGREQLRALGFNV